MKRLILLPVILLVCVGIAFLYISGDFSSGGDRASATAMDKTRAGAESGDVQAQYTLAEAYQGGIGVDKDLHQAYRWYEKAAEKGDNRSRLAVARMLENGDGVRQDFKQAIKWYRLASKIGHLAEADFALGQMYFYGHGVIQDYNEAFDWYAKAAAKGHPVAKHLLGGMYEEGWAVERDLIEAYKWYTLAIPHRLKIIEINPLYDPQRSRDMLARKMNNFQIDRGVKRAKGWKRTGN
ncbi:MAG: sel1 repeat family protein [Rhodospirillaceae bacterium]|nr:sel1 repeat family protein [Rhodospirillaceae bacterium]